MAPACPLPSLCRRFGRWVSCSQSVSQSVCLSLNHLSLSSAEDDFEKGRGAAAGASINVSIVSAASSPCDGVSTAAMKRGAGGDGGHNGIAAVTQKEQDAAAGYVCLQLQSQALKPGEWPSIFDVRHCLFFYPLPHM